ncbi:PEP-CTERM sorting domain-containing protein [Crocosphaera sp.]|uniref:PEP-CTERM sorting domain-containing protein n=1 Tax=Crocosphaera sp. TaxID=2729996 RepID=UPI00260D2436|nr:PEP-CTERM sorting domain-containing protein [Crocosphaera sp.]MDJ0581934.1 PEP-CTERM sorting domain-containing protein [Crocosphaera sp.]
MLEFDDSDLSISQFSFDFEGINYTEADLIDPEIFFDNGQFLGLVADVIDTDVEFSFLEAVPVINEPASFIYFIDGQEAGGEIAYTLQNNDSLVAVPEPSTLLGSMIIVAFGLGSLVKRQIK